MVTMDHSPPYLPKVFMLSKLSGRLTPAVSGRKRPMGMRRILNTISVGVFSETVEQQMTFQGLKLDNNFCFNRFPIGVFKHRFLLDCLPDLGYWQWWRSVIWWSREPSLTTCSEKVVFKVGFGGSSELAYRVDNQRRCHLADHGHQVDHCHPLPSQGGGQHLGR